jgi:hypothetical protein
MPPNKDGRTGGADSVGEVDNKGPDSEQSDDNGNSFANGFHKIMPND